MRAFFQKAGNEEVSNDQLHIEVSMGVIVGDTNFRICCDIAS